MKVGEEIIKASNFGIIFATLEGGSDAGIFTFEAKQRSRKNVEEAQASGQTAIALVSAWLSHSQGQEVLETLSERITRVHRALKAPPRIAKTKRKRQNQTRAIVLGEQSSAPLTCEFKKPSAQVDSAFARSARGVQNLWLFDKRHLVRHTILTSALDRCGLHGTCKIDRSIQLSQIPYSSFSGINLAEKNIFKNK
ncbi:hypothetical protein O181_012886 [Austropuccinia psidii MF-1]|uniref:Uncharacterized protein n=1 Tax=Austropuccinia psidii MF-1 TaxID=1389203 RepID=A0A9Q3GMQ3_9BASI|nr:hypothetical protein [Austropuccinia psidii MF-1]